LQNLATLLSEQREVTFGSKIVPVEADGFWFIVGGKDLFARTYPDVQRYNAAANKWEDVAPLPKSVWSPSIVSMDGKLYVLGKSYKAIF